jgi:hypothetical protein
MTGLLSVVVNDFDIISISFSPPETDAPLVIDADAVLTVSIPRQLFKSVRWWAPQIFDTMSIVQHTQFPQCGQLDIARKLSRKLAVEDLHRLFVRKRLDHGRRV